MSGLLLLLLFAACHAPKARARIFHGDHLRAAEYTTNSICVEKNCINPVFPALRKFNKNVLDTNQNRTWTCASSHNAWRGAGMCEKVVAGYHFALPVPEDGEELSEESLVRRQARDAVEAYVAHVSGMGRDFWTLTEPWKHDQCVQAVWRMACFTHFPRCNQLADGQYLRPCASSCQNYLHQCKVSCCDEGVQCVFTHHRQQPDGQLQVEEGYINHAGPSLLCTGAAALGARPLLALAALLAAWAASTL